MKKKKKIVHKKICVAVIKTPEYTERRFELLCKVRVAGRSCSYWWRDVTCPDCLKKMPRTTKLYRKTHG